MLTDILQSFQLLSRKADNIISSIKDVNDTLQKFRDAAERIAAMAELRSILELQKIEVDKRPPSKQLKDHLHTNNRSLKENIMASELGDDRPTNIPENINDLTDLYIENKSCRNNANDFCPESYPKSATDSDSSCKYTKTNFDNNSKKQKENDWKHIFSKNCLQINSRQSVKVFAKEKLSNNNDCNSGKSSLNCIYEKSQNIGIQHEVEGKIEEYQSVKTVALSMVSEAFLNSNFNSPHDDIKENYSEETECSEESLKFKSSNECFNQTNSNNNTLQSHIVSSTLEEIQLADKHANNKSLKDESEGDWYDNSEQDFRSITPFSIDAIEVNESNQNNVNQKTDDLRKEPILDDADFKIEKEREIILNYGNSISDCICNPEIVNTFSTSPKDECHLNNSQFHRNLNDITNKEDLKNEKPDEQNRTSGKTNTIVSSIEESDLVTERNDSENKLPSTSSNFSCTNPRIITPNSGKLKYSKSDFCDSGSIGWKISKRKKCKASKKSTSSSKKFKSQTESVVNKESFAPIFNLTEEISTSNEKILNATESSSNFSSELPQTSADSSTNSETCFASRNDQLPIEVMENDNRYISRIEPNVEFKNVSVKIKRLEKIPANINTILLPTSSSSVSNSEVDVDQNTSCSKRESESHGYLSFKINKRSSKAIPSECKLGEENNSLNVKLYSKKSKKNNPIRKSSNIGVCLNSRAVNTSTLMKQDSQDLLNTRSSAIICSKRMTITEKRRIREERMKQTRERREKLEKEKREKIHANEEKRNRRLLAHEERLRKKIADARMRAKTKKPRDTKINSGEKPKESINCERAEACSNLDRTFTVDTSSSQLKNFSVETNVRKGLQSNCPKQVSKLAPLNKYTKLNESSSTDSARKFPKKCHPFFIWNSSSSADSTQDSNSKRGKTEAQNSTENEITKYYSKNERSERYDKIKHFKKVSGASSYSSEKEPTKVTAKFNSETNSWEKPFAPSLLRSKNYSARNVYNYLKERKKKKNENSSSDSLKRLEILHQDTKLRLRTSVILKKLVHSSEFLPICTSTTFKKPTTSLKELESPLDNFQNDPKLTIMKPHVLVKDVSKNTAEFMTKNIKELGLRAKKTKRSRKCKSNKSRSPKNLKTILKNKNNPKIMKRKTHISHNFKSINMPHLPKVTFSNSLTSYELSDMEESSDEENNKYRNKKVPSWAKDIYLKQALLQQHYSPPNVDEIFGDLECYNTVDLAEVFNINKPQYHIRSSSAEWSKNYSPI